MPPQSVKLRLGDNELRVGYQVQRDGSVVLYRDAGGDDDENGENVGAESNGLARIHDWRPDGIDIEVDGHRRDVTVTFDANRVHVQVARGTLSFDVLPRFVPPGGGDVSGGLAAPMPGEVLDVRCAVGDVVEARQILVVLEAMKMEHHVSAPFDGVVTEVRVAPGDQVENSAMLLIIEEGQAEQ
jgi:propionyl-CoA carboxylase alpha chain